MITQSKPAEDFWKVLLCKIFLSVFAQNSGAKPNETVTVSTPIFFV